MAGVHAVESRVGARRSRTADKGAPAASRGGPGAFSYWGFNRVALADSARKPLGRKNLRAARAPTRPAPCFQPRTCLFSRGRGGRIMRERDSTSARRRQHNG